MAKPPRKPRPIARSTQPPVDIVTSPAIVRHVDPRQAELFVPGLIPPCKPTLRDRVPVGPRWQYEIKHDGYRMQAHARAGRIRLYTKSGLDYAARMPAVCDAVATLGRDLVLDGEAVMTGPDGVTDFFALHAALARGSAPAAEFYAFDLLWLDGEDLRLRALGERRAMLAEALVGVPVAIVLSEHLTEGGEMMLRSACAMGLEGIIAKRVDRPYRSGRCEDWVKVKCTTVAPFAVIGFDPAGRTGVASLRIARLDEAGGLVPCGWVGSGISEAVSRALRAALDAGEPVVVDVEHRGMTPAGELRHPVFRGWHREA